jgi:hypothetical protein
VDGRNYRYSLTEGASVWVSWHGNLGLNFLGDSRYEALESSHPERTPANSESENSIIKSNFLKMSYGNFKSPTENVLEAMLKWLSPYKSYCFVILSTSAHVRIGR